MTDLEWAATHVQNWHKDPKRMLVVDPVLDTYSFPKAADPTRAVNYHQWLIERNRLGLDIPFSQEEFKHLLPYIKVLSEPARLDTTPEPNPVQPTLLTSTQLLDACKAVQEQRGSEYQRASERSFQTVSEAFNTITGRDLKPSDITFILVLLKAVRQYTNPDRLHEDSVLDLISYSSLWGEELYKEHKDTLV